MVQANVGQKFVICDILRVFFCDQFLLFHATSREINAIHKINCYYVICYIDPPNQVSHRLLNSSP